MAMSSAAGDGGIASTPNVTPMIDVMLVLLIIFMVVTPQLLAGFNADPPKAITLKDHAQDHVLGLDEEGRYYLDKKPYTADQIPGLINSIYSNAGRDNFVLYVRADGKLKYEKVQDAMDIAMHNKVRMVGLVGEQQPGTTSTIKGDIVTP